MDTVNHTQKTKAGENTPVLSGKILAICIGLIAIAVIALTIFKVSLGTLVFAGALLLCPLMHVWIMGKGEHKH